MAREVKWTVSAWRDLEEVAEYIAKDSPHYAGAFVCEVRDAARSLAYLAERGRTVPEFEDLTIRELFVRSYRLICRAYRALDVSGAISADRSLGRRD